MDDARAVRVVERVEHVAGQAQGGDGLHRPAKHIGQRGAVLHILQNQVEQIALLAEIVDR